MFRSVKAILVFATALVLFSACGERLSVENKSMDSSMCKKLSMQPDGIVRLSKVQVNPDYIEEYMKYAVEVGEISLKTEPGVLTMYAVADKENPCNITILETYASQEAYRSTSPQNISKSISRARSIWSIRSGLTT